MQEGPSTRRAFLHSFEWVRAGSARVQRQRRKRPINGLGCRTDGHGRSSSHAERAGLAIDSSAATRDRALEPARDTSTTQNELLVRIAIFLTLVLASVVSLYSLAKRRTSTVASTCSPWSVLDLASVGTLTLLRVFNGGEEDLAYVIGMNRLRAASTELDRGIDRYFVASRHDDDRGIGQRTPTSLRLRLLQPLASSMMFILVVDAVVAGVLAGLAANAADASGRWSR